MKNEGGEDMREEYSKLKIISQTGHFGELFGYDDRGTYKVPPVSTVIGILKVIYGEDIVDKDFKFGYIYRDKGQFKDDITMYKHIKGGSKLVKGKQEVTDCRYIEYNFECELIIYTDIVEDIKLEYILSMGRSGNISTLELPVEKVVLDNKVDTKCYNVLTPMNIGGGKISNYNMLSKFNNDKNCYDHQMAKLRFNKEIDIKGNYDVIEDQGVFMWEMRKGEVIESVRKTSN